MTEAEAGVTQLLPRTTKECQPPLELGRGKEGLCTDKRAAKTLPTDCRASTALPVP